MKNITEKWRESKLRVNNQAKVSLKVEAVIEVEPHKMSKRKAKKPLSLKPSTKKMAFKMAKRLH
jgi:hypothetical protein